MSEPHEIGPQGQAARDAYASAQERNPFLTYVDRNGYLAFIAEADWRDVHNGSAVGFLRPAPTHTEADDFGTLPYLVVCWNPHDSTEKVRGSRFWTKRHAQNFQELQEAGFRNVVIRHYAPLDPVPMVHTGWCWHEECARIDCDGIDHRGKNRYEWEQPYGTSFNQATGHFEFPPPVNAEKENHPTD